MVTFWYLDSTFYMGSAVPAESIFKCALSVSFGWKDGKGLEMDKKGKPRL
jgi:hypothetical protein